MASGRNIKGITVEIDGDATGLSKALQSVNSEIKSTESQLKDVEKLLKIDPGNTELLTQKQKLLNDEIGHTKEKLETLKTASDQAKTALENGTISTEQYDALQREIVETEEKLKSLERQAESSATAIQKIAATGETLKTTGTNISNVGTSLMPVTAAVVAAGTAAVKTTADFDEGMSKVAAVSGAAGEELEQLTAKAREMGAKTKFSATEAAEAMNYMAMAGWKTSDMLNGIEGIMNLAAAAGEDLGTTSDIVTDALTAFGLTASDSAHFADILAAASSNANTNVSMMGETFKYCAPVAGALGYTAEDVAEAIGLMANSGIKASQAGTSLRTILTKLQGEIALTGENLGNVTIQTVNTDGSMRELTDILSDCRAAFSQLTESEAAAAAETLVGKNAMSGFLALMQAAPADIEKLRGAIATCSDEVDGYNGACEQMAAVMQDNLSGQLVILKSQLEELAISFGTIMIPVIRNVVSVIQKIVDKLNSLDDSTRERIINIALIVAAVGPLLIVIGKVISAVGTVLTLIPKMISLFTKVTSLISKLGGLGAKLAGLAPILTKVKTAFSSLWAVAAAHPIVLIIAAIAALVAAFVVLWNKCEGFRNFWINLWDNIKNAASNAWSSISGFFSQAFEDWKTGVQIIWSGVKEKFVTAWTDIKDGVSTVVNAMRDGMASAFSSIKEFAVSTWENIKNSAIFAWDAIKLKITSVVTEIGAFLSEAWTLITQTMTMILQILMTLFITIWQSIHDFLFTSNSETELSLNEIWTRITTAISEFLNQIFANVISIFSSIWSSVSTYMNNVYNTIVNGFNNAVSFIYGLIGQAYSWGADLIGNVISGIRSMMGSLISTVSSIASTIWSYLHFSEPEVGPLSDFHTWMPDFMQGLADGIEKSKGVVKDAVSGLASDFMLNPQTGEMTGAQSTASQSTVTHTGTIRVEGVSDTGMLSGVVDIIIDQLRQEVRV